MDALEIILPAAVAASVIVIGLFSGSKEKKRRAEFAALAGQLGFDFRPDYDAKFPKEWLFLRGMNRGIAPVVHHLLEGRSNDHPVLVFDYHFEEQDTYFNLTFFLLKMPGANFPDITIKPGAEKILARAEKALIGVEDIHFDSADFSRHFCVRSKDKKFAYDVCNAEMIEYLLANRDLPIEIRGTAILLSFQKQLPVNQIEFNLQRLAQIRSLLPDYLFANA